jgi:hypothetical protein
MPRLQPFATMSRDERRAYLILTLDVVLDIMCDVDAPVIVSPPFVFSTSSRKDEDNVSST